MFKNKKQQRFRFGWNNKKGREEAKSKRTTEQLSSSECDSLINSTDASTLPSSNNAQKLQRREKKSVHFRENLAEEIFQQNESDPSELWYSSEEIKEFKGSQKSIAYDLARSKCGYRDAIKACYLACCQVRFETSACILTREEEDALIDALSKSDSLGLDVVCLGKQFLGDRKEKLLKLAIEQQYQDPERIRSMSQVLSLPGRLYARHLARAHADLLRFQD